MCPRVWWTVFTCYNNLKGMALAAQLQIFFPIPSNLLNKLRHIHTMENYAIIRNYQKKKLLIHGTTEKSLILHTFSHNMQMSKINCYKTVCIVYIKGTELCIYVNRNKIGYVSVKMLHDSIMLCASLYFLYFLHRTHLLYN